MKYLFLTLILFSSCKTFKKTKSERLDQKSVKIESNNLSLLKSDLSVLTDIGIKEYKIERFEAVDSSGISVIKPIVITSISTNKKQKESKSKSNQFNIYEAENIKSKSDTISVKTDAESYDAVKSVVGGIFGGIKKYVYWTVFAITIFFIIIALKKYQK
jgi:hypothetical protein